MNCFAHGSVKTGFEKEPMPSESSLAGGKQAQHGCKFLPSAWGWCTWLCTPESRAWASPSMVQVSWKRPACLQAETSKCILRPKESGFLEHTSLCLPWSFRLTVPSFLGIGLALAPQPLDCPERLSSTSLRRPAPSHNRCHIPLCHSPLVDLTNAWNYIITWVFAFKYLLPSLN